MQNILASAAQLQVLRPSAQQQDQPHLLPQLPLLKPPLNSVSDAHSPFVFKHLGSSARKMHKLVCPAWSLAPTPVGGLCPVTAG